MPIQITNSLTRSKETFTPLEPGTVRMYVCGPTVYGLTHVGNARPAVFFDVVRRFFESRGFRVVFVSNFTDVDDKIINRARAEGKSSLAVAEHFVLEFQKDMASLGILPATHAPKVTEHIPAIVKLVEALVANGSAYVAEDGEVFFSIRSFREYGKLSGKKIDDLLTGVRIQPGERKRDPLDFSLWKPQKSPDEPSWQSPWGPGRPGWHIECSAMAIQYLGETFDIHGGGIDLTHPHHENEIAQSESVTHKIFARYWMHNNLVAIGQEKMSKSVGNIFLNRDFIETYTAEALKFLLLSGHYRSPIDFSQKHIRECLSALHRFYSTADRIDAVLSLSNPTSSQSQPHSVEESELIKWGNSFESNWIECLEDDFNTAKVVGLVFEYVRLLNAYSEKKPFRANASTWEIFRGFQQNKTKLSRVLNLFGEPPSVYLELLKTVTIREKGIERSQIEKLVQKRTEARSKKDFKESDRIRDELKALGVTLQDSPDGTKWDVVFQ